MSFSCTIKQGKKDLTSYKSGLISPGLFGLAPNCNDDTGALYRLTELRDVVSRCAYGHICKEAAQDCFKSLQSLVRENVEYLIPCHCETCKCKPVIPTGWGGEPVELFLSIDPDSITSIEGGY